MDVVSTADQLEIAKGDRFAFGANWAAFLSVVDDQRIAEAIESLQRSLGVTSLVGRSFVDIGSGSGLFSLAAHRLGAAVHSFDFDVKSVACTAEMRRRYAPNSTTWKIEQGSVLDREYLKSLGQFDVVYSWGVLHHTGAMWQALANVAELVNRQGGNLFIALYNDQGAASRYWAFVKRTYNKSRLARAFWVAVHLVYPTVPRYIVHALRPRRRDRGMTVWYDLFDWLGGWPFEVARPAEIVEFYEERGWSVVSMNTVGRRLGCNEFVFKRH